MYRYRFTGPSAVGCIIELPYWTNFADFFLKQGFLYLHIEVEMGRGEQRPVLAEKQKDDESTRRTQR
jgi:hypothetical protein